MKDQSSLLCDILRRKVPVLVYHGNFDLVLPVSGMAETLQNLPCNSEYKYASNEPYKSDQNELMGYIQSGGGLDFVVIRNVGHMVPIDSPVWSLKIVRDFLQKTENI